MKWYSIFDIIRLHRSRAKVLGQDKMLISITIMLLLLAEINHSQGCSGLCKINESPISVDYRICGDQITETYAQVCGNVGKRNRITHGLDHRSFLYSSPRLAKRFLISRRQTGGQTNIVEECCIEGCKAEEVREYCP